MTYSVYIDESGTHAGSRAMVLAGYVFKSIEASRFARDWSGDLKRFGIPFAHQTDCATGNGVYVNMGLNDRIKVQTKLIQLIRKRALFGFSVIADPVWVANNMKLNQLPESPSVYSMLAVACLNTLNDWADKNEYNGQFSFIFESGHASQSEANRMLNGCAIDSVLRKRWRYLTHSFQDKKDCLPLQAADMIAWQYHHYWDQRVKRGKYKHRADFRALSRRCDIACLFPPNSFPPQYGPPDPFAIRPWTD